MAQDKGYPPLSRTVEVQIDVVDRANNPPVWDHTVYGPIYVKENMPVGGKVVSIKARSVHFSCKKVYLKKKNQIKIHSILLSSILRTAFFSYHDSRCFFFFLSYIIGYWCHVLQ